MRSVYIRVDANKTIGSGHVMRCLSIAYELKKHGMDVEFLLSDEDSTKPIEGAGLDYRVLHMDWRQLGSDDDVALVAPILSQNKSKPVLLVDSYLADNGYFLKLKEWTKLVFIDDLFASTYDVDMIINYTVCHKLFDYDYVYEGKTARLLLGTRYVPLREQFRILNVERKIKNGPLQILLMSGGGDPLHALAGILEYGTANGLISGDIYHVVAGAYHPDIEQLRRLGQEYGNISIHRNVTDMANLMSQCDIAVSAAGTTLYECCAMALPTIFFCMADNQYYDGLCFMKENLMLCAGDFRFQREECIRNVFSHIEYLRENPDVRQVCGYKMRTIVDGLGAERIAEEIGRLKTE